MEEEREDGAPELLYMEPELYDQIRILAAIEDVSVQELIVMALEKYVNESIN